LTSIWRRNSSAQARAPGRRPQCRIVDETGERFALQRVAHLARGGQHRGLIGDVKDQRREIGAELAFQAVGVGPFAHAAEYRKPRSSSSFALASRCGGRAVMTTDLMLGTAPFGDAGLM